MPMQRVTLFDTTLRDGAQTSGVDFSPGDKLRLAALLDDFGLHYIEGGWPGANDTDNIFFTEVPAFKKAKLTAFGMTRRVGKSASNDEGLSMVLDTSAPVVCLVGKTWGPHITTALNTTVEENLRAIRESVARAKSMKSEVVYDLEHFFDAYKHDPDYALACMRAAKGAGADWLVMCDTNGGTFPHEVRDIVGAVMNAGFSGGELGIHTHDDMSCAVANTLEAVRLGVEMVQGTLNGLGERCGNANLITLIPMFAKMGIDCGISPEKMRDLTALSRALDDILDRSSDDSAPYVGARAFTHKGGLHGSAVAKAPSLYEHTRPESVGNRRILPMSDQGGLANLMARLEDYGMAVRRDDPRLGSVVERIKMLEAEGYAYDRADASFELLLRHMLGGYEHYFYALNVNTNTKMQPIVNEARREFGRASMGSVPEASVKLIVGNERLMHAAEGVGPVDAIDAAMRKALIPYYPVLANMTLSDFKVRIIKPREGTAATTVVRIESTGPVAGKTCTWSTIGVSHNVIDAALEALIDSHLWYLHKTGTPAIVPNPALCKDEGVSSKRSPFATGTQPR
ncbi:MAG: citramalate synthase [Alphaproteobacteria bacterium]|nr:citramalate synthase [Alphaproteobacteria bacterium]USO07464.1 MAG: citramalate synthase [Rhodospirillales bacterium]